MVDQKDIRILNLYIDALEDSLETLEKMYIEKNKMCADIKRKYTEPENFIKKLIKEEYIKERVKKITKGLKRLGIKWALETRVDLVDEKSLKMLADSGQYLSLYHELKKAEKDFFALLDDPEIKFLDLPDVFVQKVNRMKKKILNQKE